MIKVLQPCLLVLFIGSSLSGFSQEKSQSVIASAADISKAGNVILEWTVGEPAVETLSNSAAIYTQGFHQPLLEVQKMSTGRDLASVKDIVRVYPNPSTAIINVQLQKATPEALVVSLIDVSGKVLLNNNLPANSTILKINVSRLSQGAYILRITNAQGNIQGNYKIIKAQ